MKIFDCFMYFDEDLILDLRLNYLNKYVDYFVEVESKFNHNGERREPCFNINKYKKFKEKIIYLLVNDVGHNFHKIHEPVGWIKGLQKKILKIPSVVKKY